MENAITNEDLFKLLQGLVEKTNEIQKENQQRQLENKQLIEEVKTEIKDIKTNISHELEQLKGEHNTLKEQFVDLKKSVEINERKLKKYNLVVYGLEESESEIHDIQRFLDIINNTLRVDCRFQDIRDIYRFGNQSTRKVRPISVELVSYKQKIDILNKAKELKSTKIYIKNDYTLEDYKKQKVLYQNLKIARENNYEAVIKKNILYVDGQAYTYDELQNKHNNEVTAKEKSADSRKVNEETTNQKDRTENPSAGCSTDILNGQKSFKFLEEPNPKKRKAKQDTAENPKRVTRKNSKF